MIARLHGRLTAIREDAVVLERDGLAFEVLVSQAARNDLLSGAPEELTLHTVFYLEGNPTGTHLVPRLIGFLAECDREFFQAFTRVKGISARRALRAMAVPTPVLAAAIEQGDLRVLTALPEIGKKTAEQIVAGLRGHLAVFAQSAPTAAPRAPLSSAQRTAVDILVQWGDRRADAERLVAEALAEDPSLGEPEAIVRACYRLRTRSAV